jgi:hypothetical protein
VFKYQSAKEIKKMFMCKKSFIFLRCSAKYAGKSHISGIDVEKYESKLFKWLEFFVGTANLSDLSVKQVKAVFQEMRKRTVPTVTRRTTATIVVVVSSDIFFPHLPCCKIRVHL